MHAFVILLQNNEKNVFLIYFKIETNYDQVWEERFFNYFIFSFLLVIYILITMTRTSPVALIISWYKSLIDKLFFGIYWFWKMKLCQEQRDSYEIKYKVAKFSPWRQSGTFLELRLQPENRNSRVSYEWKTLFFTHSKSCLKFKKKIIQINKMQIKKTDGASYCLAQLK